MSCGDFRICCNIIEQDFSFGVHHTTSGYCEVLFRPLYLDSRGIETIFGKYDLVLENYFFFLFNNWVCVCVFCLFFWGGRIKYLLLKVSSSGKAKYFFISCWYCIWLTLFRKVFYLWGISQNSKLFSVNVKTEKQESWFLRELLTPECRLVWFLKFKF